MWNWVAFLSILGGTCFVLNHLTVAYRTALGIRQNTYGIFCKPLPRLGAGPDMLRSHSWHQEFTHWGALWSQEKDSCHKNNKAVLSFWLPQWEHHHFNQNVSSRLLPHADCLPKSCLLPVCVMHPSIGPWFIFSLLFFVGFPQHRPFLEVCQMLDGGFVATTY